jgi:hypothetical protein
MKMRMVTAIVPAIVLTISLSPCDTHYVSPTGSNQYPYTTPETAASKIQDAIDAAEYADTVAVAEGEYHESIRMKEEIALQGAGPDLTTLVYEPSQKEAVVLSAKDASISGFSMRGGKWGIRQLESEDQPFTVSNCCISDTTYTGVSFWGKATISDSDISRNNFRGVSVWREGSATVSNCTFMFNGQACYLEKAGSLRLDHCTLAGNEEAFRFYNSTGQAEITNGIIYGNVCDSLKKHGGKVVAGYCLVTDAELDGVSYNICCAPGLVGYGLFNDGDNPVYVDSNHSGPEEGTKANPFTSIGKVLELYVYELGTESVCLGAASDGKNIGASPDFVPSRRSGSPHVLINLAPGAYNEGDLPLSHGEHLKGAGAHLTTIDGGGLPYDHYLLCPGNGAVVERLTLTGASRGVLLDYSSPKIADCLIHHCGYGVYCSGSSAQISGCLIYDCGGGIFCENSSDTITNSTIVNSGGYGIFANEGSHLDVSDCILWYNWHDLSDAVAPEMVHHCCVQSPDLAGLNGNISADPLFVGWAGCVGEEATVHVNPAAAEPGDGSVERPFRSVSEAIASLPEYNYHLTASSPCLTASSSEGQIGAYPDDIPSGQCVSRLRIQVDAGTTEEGDMPLPRAIDLMGAGMDATVLEGGSLRLGASNTVRDLTVSRATETGIVCSSNSHAVISDCRITSCEVGVELRPDDVLQGCEVVDNEWTGVVGPGVVSQSAIACNGGHGIVDVGVVSYSVVASNGECGVNICCGADTEVENCVITDNGEHGVFIGDSTSVIRRCTIAGNKRAGIATSDSSPSIDSCVVSENGCGIILFDSSVLVTNCLIFGHVADEPGTDAYDPLGVGLPCSYAGGSRVINTTISGNSRGIACGDGSRPELINCIVQGNYDANIFLDGENASSSSGPSVIYSNVGGSSGGLGNIDADPRFLDAENGNFRLRPDSPCIDAGAIVESLPPFDLSGMHRVMFGGESLGPDMGAYEYYVNDLLPLANGQAMLLTWSSLAGRTYSILYSDDPSTWSTAAKGVISWGRTTTSWMDSPTSGTQPPPGQARRRYYRIMEEE